MSKVRTPALFCAVLAGCAIALTADELGRWSARADLPFPDDADVGTIVLLALLGCTAWLTLAVRNEPRMQAWAKTALTLAFTLPLIWIFQHQAILDELFAFPDADLPVAWVARVSGDLLQTQQIILILSLALLACVLATVRQKPPARHN